MRVSRFGSRAIGFGLVFAMAGFTFAITTGVSVYDAPAVGVRGIGTYVPLRFTNANLLGTTGNVLNPNEYDLGDALYGSALARVISAEGGVRPYRFTSADSKTTPPVLSLANAILNTTSTLTLGISGAVSGNAPVTIAPNSKTFNGMPGLRFHVTVTDANESNSIAAAGTFSTPVSGNFNLALFDPKTTAFRFANDNVPSARLDTPYFAHLDVLGGTPAITISALSVTATGAGLPVTKLSDIGLFLASDGSLYGRPLTVGTFTIVAHAVDSVGRVAFSRNVPGVVDQSVTLVVSDDPVTSSDTMTTACSLKGDTARFDTDTLNLKGLINVLGQDQFSLLNSDFEFQLGNIGFSGRLDGRGKLIQNDRNGSRFTVSVNARAGTIAIRAARGSFIKGFDLTGIKDGDLVLRPLKIVVGNAVNSTEVIQFAASVRGTSYAFNYALGRKGVNATGGFQIVSVKGRDSLTLTGLPGDAWHTAFIAQPRAKGIVINPSGLTEGIDNIRAINIRVGANFAQSFTGLGVTGAGPAIHIRGGPVDGIQSFSFSTKTGKGVVNTRVLSTADTGIITAVNSLKVSNVFFPLGLDIARGFNPATSTDATFIGEHARRIFGNGTKYSDKPALRQTPPVF